MIRVTIVSPVMAVRAGLRALLGDDPGIQVIAEGANQLEMEPVQEAPDIVVWSPASFAEVDAGLIQLSKMKTGGLAIVLIYNDPKVHERLALLPLRSWGGLDPESSPAELVASIHAVDEGLVVANPAWLRMILTRVPGSKGKTGTQVDPLTEREIEVLQQLAYGLTNKQIAFRLKISAHTVKFHVSSIFTKLEATNRIEAVNPGLKAGLIAL